MPYYKCLKFKNAQDYNTIQYIEVLMATLVSCLHQRQIETVTEKEHGKKIKIVIERAPESLSADFKKGDFILFSSARKMAIIQVGMKSIALLKDLIISTKADDLTVSAQGMPLPLEIIKSQIDSWRRMAFYSDLQKSMEATNPLKIIKKRHTSPGSSVGLGSKGKLCLECQNHQYHPLIDEATLSRLDSQDKFVARAGADKPAVMSAPVNSHAAAFDGILQLFHLNKGIFIGAGQPNNYFFFNTVLPDMVKKGLGVLYFEGSICIQVYLDEFVSSGDWPLLQKRLSDSGYCGNILHMRETLTYLRENGVGICAVDVEQRYMDVDSLSSISLRNVFMSQNILSDLRARARVAGRDNTSEKFIFLAGPGHVEAAEMLNIPSLNINLLHVRRQLGCDSRRDFERSKCKAEQEFSQGNSSDVPLHFKLGYQEFQDSCAATYDISVGDEGSFSLVSKLDEKALSPKVYRQVAGHKTPSALLHLNEHHEGVFRAFVNSDLYVDAVNVENPDVVFHGINTSRFAQLVCSSQRSRRTGLSPALFLSYCREKIEQQANVMAL